MFILVSNVKCEKGVAVSKQKKRLNKLWYVGHYVSIKNRFCKGCFKNMRKWY